MICRGAWSNEHAARDLERSLRVEPKKRPFGLWRQRHDFTLEAWRRGHGPSVLNARAFPFTNQRMSADKPEEAAESKATEGSEAEAADGAVEEIEPEIIAPDLITAKSRTIHPPPPPRLRETTGSHGRPLDVAGEPKLARDLMTRELLTISPDDPLVSLEEQMEKFRFRHLPVVEGNKLVGLITQSDLLHVSSSYLSETAKQRNEIIHKLPAKRIMRRELVTVRPIEPLASVAEEMWKTRSDCALVTDEDSNLLGILTQSDFLRLAHHYLTRESST